jgi:hypothetical protein
MTMVVGVYQPIQLCIGVGGSREGEEYTPLPYYDTNSFPFEGCWPPEVL